MARCDTRWRGPSPCPRSRRARTSRSSACRTSSRTRSTSSYCASPMPAAANWRRTRTGCTTALLQSSRATRTPPCGRWVTLVATGHGRRGRRDRHRPTAEQPRRRVCVRCADQILEPDTGQRVLPVFADNYFRSAPRELPSSGVTVPSLASRNAASSSAAGTQCQPEPQSTCRSMVLRAAHRFMNASNCGPHRRRHRHHPPHHRSPTNRRKWGSDSPVSVAHTVSARFALGSATSPGESTLERSTRALLEPTTRSTARQADGPCRPARWTERRVGSRCSPAAWDPRSRGSSTCAEPPVPEVASRPTIALAVTA